MTAKEIVEYLKTFTNPASLAGMARYGINTSSAFGVPMPVLRKLAKEIKTNTPLAFDLWNTGYHEARILAALITDPAEISKSSMDKWADDFNSWDLCDQCCNNLFVYTTYAYDKALKWSKSKKEFVKRAGFSLMASLSVHNKNLKDDDFLKFFPVIMVESDDERNFVKKSVNWALRQIGKRNNKLNKEAVKLAEKIAQRGSKSAKWIAKDAIKELNDPKVKEKFNKCTKMK